MRNRQGTVSNYLLSTLALRILLFFAIASALACAPAAAQLAIRVEPNILVSHESPLPKIQMMIVADPRDAQHLLGTAIAATPVEDVCTVYVSFDGGYSWKAIVPPGLPPTGSGDPQVVFDSQGIAYFSTLGLVPDAQAKLHFVVLLYRSGDGGLTWEKLTDFGAGTGPDHDMSITDNAGHLFISVVYSSSGRDNVGIFRLDPGEKNMRGPLHVASADFGFGIFNWNPLVLSDGTLFVPFEASRWPISKFPEREILGATSQDAGLTFSAARRIAKQTLNSNNPISPYATVTFAVDASNSRFRDRIYMVWNESDGGPSYRLKLIYSNDRGTNWSAPRYVDGPLTEHASAFKPVIFVNKEGTVGVSWLDTRESPTGRTYREFFTASFDGGDSFQKPVPVSSFASSLDELANYAVHPTIDSPRKAKDGSLEFSFDTSLGRAPDGGDFMGLTADAAGTFHPFWIDTRTGTFQVWTAAVRAGTMSTPAREAGTELNQQLRPVFDPATYDARTGTETIPVRLQNISDQPVCAPLYAIVQDTDTSPHPTPRVLNAENQKDWIGAYFDYSRAFRDLACLAPGQITEAVPWRIQPLASERTFVTLNFTVSHTKPK